MSEERNDLLFETENTRSRDTDGDGVSDVQESLDGTDPNDAESNIRHDGPLVDVFGGNDPRVGIDGTILERETIVDVAGSMPEGHSLEQTLGTGLDGKAIGKSPNDLGYGFGDEMMEGRGADPNSPLNMQRNPLIANPAAKPVEGRDSTIETLGREAGPGADSGNQKSEAGHSTPPPGADLSFRAPHTDQISAPKEPKPFDESKHKGPNVDPKEPKEVPKTPGKEEPSALSELWDYLTSDKPDKPKDDGKYDTGEGDSLDVVTGDEFERVIAVHGADTDFVPGAGTHIDDSRPPKRPGDLVTDPGDEDPGADGTGANGTGTVTPPGGEISKPVNPNDGVLGGGLPPGWGTGGGGSGGGDGGDNTGRDGFSSAATAATNTSAPDAGSGVVNIGTESTSGIQSAGDDNGVIAPISELEGEVAVANDLALGLDDLIDEPFAQRSTEVDDLVPAEPSLEEGF